MKIVTDSGGLQREAYYAQVPYITLDTSTGWPETVKERWNTLFEEFRNKNFIEKDVIIEKIINFEP